MTFPSVFQIIFAKNYFTRSVRKNNTNFSCKYGKLYLPLLAETITTKAMRTKTQLYHYLLSFADTRLIKWYNNCVVDAFGDYSEQTIAVNNQEATIYWATLYGLEKLCSIMKNKNSRVFDEDLWIAVCGGEKPYIITFNSFEEFLGGLSEEDRNGLLEYAGSEPDYLRELEQMAKNRQK